MKAKVINRMSEYFDLIIDVRMLNYKYIYGLGPDSKAKVKVYFEDVEFVFDHEWERNIVKYRDILRICLPEATTIKYYAAICSVMEEYFKGDIKNISIIRDVNEKARKGYWYKRIEIVINGTHPVYVGASGRNYSDMYNINMEDIDVNSFICACKDGICNLKENINRNFEQLRYYEKVLHRLTSPQEENSIYNAIEGK